MHAKRGQSMVETVIALAFIIGLFLTVYQLSRMVATRTLLDHAAARAARAKAVGFNDFMCEKSARVAMIPVAGHRVWPADEAGFSEAARVPIYLTADDWSLANGILDYEYWHTMDFDVGSGSGLNPVAESFMAIRTPDFYMEGRAQVESHFPFYMYDQGE